MIEKNKAIPSVLETDITCIRRKILELAEHNGLDLAKVSPEHLSSILFSDNPNEALTEEVVNLSKEKKGVLLFREANELLEEISFTPGEDRSPYLNQAVLRLVLNHLIDIFNPEICASSTENKKKLVLNLASNVVYQMVMATEKHNESCRDVKFDPREYEFYDEDFPDDFICMILKTFPSIGLTKEEILNHCKGSVIKEVNW